MRHCGILTFQSVHRASTKQLIDHYASLNCTELSFAEITSLVAATHKSDLRTAASPDLVLETHPHTPAEVRSPVLLSQYQKYLPGSNSLMLNIRRYGTSLSKIGAFYHHHLMHLKMKYLWYSLHPFLFIYVTHTHLRN